MGLAHRNPRREVLKSSEVRQARVGKAFRLCQHFSGATSRLTERQTHFDIKTFYSDPIQYDMILKHSYTMKPLVWLIEKAYGINYWIKSNELRAIVTTGPISQPDF